MKSLIWPFNGKKYHITGTKGKKTKIQSDDGKFKAEITKKTLDLFFVIPDPNDILKKMVNK